MNHMKHAGTRIITDRGTGPYSDTCIGDRNESRCGTTVHGVRPADDDDVTVDRPTGYVRGVFQ